MRGSPFIRVALIALALTLASLLVNSVLKKTPREQVSPPVPSAPEPSSGLVPTLVTVTLSSPATSLTLTEPSGRVIEIPTADGLELEHDAELTLSNKKWSGSLAIEWEDPSRPNFLRLDFEPLRLKSQHILLDLHQNAANHPLTANFDPNEQAP